MATDGNGIADVPPPGCVAEAEREAQDLRLEAGRHLFAQECRFMRGAAARGDLPPPDLPECAFAGRSNVGKSSLLNALTGRRSLARTARTPGRTRELNFFDLGSRLCLVDMPGYGYARASRTAIAGWTRLIHDYIRGRENLRRLLLLVDARHGLKDSDRALMELMDGAGLAYAIVLTKCDKAGGVEALSQRIRTLEGELTGHPAAAPSVLCSSARSGTGIGELRAGIAELVAQG